jgi:hypothetical protein
MKLTQDNSRTKGIVAGIDVGTVLHRPTSGVCRSGGNGFSLTHTFIDRLSRKQALEPFDRFDVIAVDGPVLPIDVLDYRIRPVEKLYLWGAFHRRCKAGETTHGIGAAVRRGGCDTAVQFADTAQQADCDIAIPRVQRERNVVEAFPNCFMGVMLPDDCFRNPIPRLSRGEKFGWLLERWRANRIFVRLRNLLTWNDDRFWREIEFNTHHEEQAGLVCALTAICALREKYVAVGEQGTGYFFLPPWRTWAPWAKDGLRRNLRDRRLRIHTDRVEIWINGKTINVAPPLQ